MTQLSPGSKDDKSLTQSESVENNDVNKYLGAIRLLLSTPFLTFLKVYLQAKNGNKKTPENCVADFSSCHKRTMKIIFILDMSYMFLYTSIALIVFLILLLRALNIDISILINKLPDINLHINNYSII